MRRAPNPVETARGRVGLLPFVLIGAAALGVGAGLAFTGQMFKENVELVDRPPASPVPAIEQPQAPGAEASVVPQTEPTAPLPAVQTGEPSSDTAMIRPPPAKPVRLPAAAVDGIGGPAEASSPVALRTSPSEDLHAGPFADGSSAAADTSRGADGARLTRPGNGRAIGPALAVQGDLATDAPLFLGQVFVHYSTIGDGPGDEAEAMAVSQRLEQAGYRITDIRPVGFRIRRANIRYFHPDDRAPAERLRHDLDSTMNPPPTVMDFTTYRPRPRAGTLEVWVESSS